MIKELCNLNGQEVQNGYTQSKKVVSDAALP